MKNLIVKAITSPSAIYAFRCLIGFVIGYALYIRYVEYELFWGLLSIILVISPEEKDSRKLSIDRVKSNFIGSVVAMACVLFDEESHFVTIVTGILITILVCKLFKILNYARVAIVALLIILIEPHHSSITFTPFFRFLTVAGGCLIGLLIVISTSYLLQNLRKRFLLED